MRYHKYSTWPTKVLAHRFVRLLHFLHLLKVYAIWMNLILMGLVPSILLIVLNSLMLRSLIGHLRTEDCPIRTASPVPMMVTASDKPAVGVRGDSGATPSNALTHLRHDDVAF